MVEDAPDPTPLRVGDDVWVRSLAKRGRLKGINARGEAEVQFGKLAVKVKNGDYYKVK